MGKLVFVNFAYCYRYHHFSAANYHLRIPGYINSASSSTPSINLGPETLNRSSLGVYIALFFTASMSLKAISFVKESPYEAIIYCGFLSTKISGDTCAYPSMSPDIFFNFRS